MTDRYRALRMHAPATPGGVPDIRIDRLIDPDLAPGEVLLDVHFSSINYKDALALAGRNGIIRDHPRIGGIDLAGTVRRSADPRWQAGDAVIAHGLGLGVSHDGGHAERALVPADWLLPLPPGLSLLEAATLGAAGFTAALALQMMEHEGLQPERGPVLVTGATGGVAGIAIDILSQRGYHVVALTGKDDAHGALRALGATEVLSRHTLETGGKPLEKARWAGAVDSVGGELLSWITRTTLPHGVITAFGNAGGADLHTSVLPFILRGVRLLGINGSDSRSLRLDLWHRLATDYRPRRLDQVAHVIGLDQVPAAATRMLEGRSRGRLVINLR